MAQPLTPRSAAIADLRTEVATLRNALAAKSTEVDRLTAQVTQVTAQLARQEQAFNKHTHYYEIFGMDGRRDVTGAPNR
jgi:ABC-type transporter Mla subunit MlaD